MCILDTYEVLRLGILEHRRQAGVGEEDQNGHGTKIRDTGQRNQEPA
jgi:hypothetical protein